MKRHLSIDIAGFLRKAQGQTIKGLMNHEDGTDCTDQEVREFLADCLLKGWKLIPVGDCTNFDHQKGCQGHPDAEIKTMLKKELLITSKKEKQ